MKTDSPCCTKCSNLLNKSLQQGHGAAVVGRRSEPLSLHQLALSPPARNIDIPFFVLTPKV